MALKEFRNPPRYMVGDIVYSHGFICVVCSIYPFNIDYSYDLKIFDGQSLGKICQNDIMHVHIWEEFLKKNGWKKSKVNDCAYFYYKDELFLTYTLKDNKFWFDDFDYSSTICVELPYVHSLQHLFFGLGLDSNLKI